MNSRKLFRKFAQYNGREAKEFVEIEYGWEGTATLITKDSKGNIEKTHLGWDRMVYWIANNNKTIFNEKSKTTNEVDGGQFN